MKKIIMCMIIQQMFSLFGMNHDVSMQGFCQDYWWNGLCENAQENKMGPLSFVCGNSTPISWLGCSRVDALSRVLLRKDIDINQQDEDTLMTPLHWLCVGDKPSRAVALLLSAPNINVNLQTVDGYTPLHLACIHTTDFYDNRIDQLLATGKIDFSLQNGQGKNIIQFARDRYSKWWETCDDLQCWHAQEIERCIAMREWVMHKILRATARPMQYALIMTALSQMTASSQKKYENDEHTPRISNVIGVIAHMIYALDIELVVARKYCINYLERGQSYEESDAFQQYYQYSNDTRKQIKENMTQKPTKEDICLR